MNAPWLALVCTAALTLAKDAPRPAPPPRPTPAPTPAPSRGTCALRAGESLFGTYLCAQGWTALTLHIRAVSGSSVQAEFVFNHTPSRAAGRYTLAGTCAPDGRVRLTPIAWIEQPPGYIMVGMDGVVSGATYSGTITHDACGSFRLSR